MYKGNRYGPPPPPKPKGIAEICTEDVNERRRETLMKVLNLTRSLNLKQTNNVTRKQFVYPLDGSSSNHQGMRRGGRGVGGGGRENNQEQRTRRFVNPALSSRGPALCPSTAYITMMKLCDRLENDIKNEQAAKNTKE
ncbi:uncharacterized protein LOC111054657 [Nilaparvata lugens]|uniref:uncharacterized protein LOC111054657 n=1 Tax=Nilaparvata lugens TaxID=108931 RepID=UPI00193CE7DA|nr:uncharacterized protein LOC111054657 [Nilaparvata lugens]